MTDLTKLSDQELLQLLGAASEGPNPRITGSPPSGPGLSREAAASAAAEETGLSAIPIGTGRVLDTAAKGVQQGALEAASAFSPGDKNIRATLDTLKSNEADNTTAYKGVQKRFPMETAVGESLPYAGFTGGWPAVGAKAALLEGSRYGSPEERIANAVVGGGSAAAGTAAGRTVGGYVNPNLSKTQRDVLTEGGKMGMKPRLSQVLQSPSIERFEDYAARVPVAAGVMDRFARGNQKAVNAGAAKSMGQVPDESGNVSEEVFANAKRDLGAVFEKVKNLGQVAVGGRLVNPIQLNPGVGAAADDVLKTQAKLGVRANQEVVKLATEAKNAAAARGRIDGEAYQLWHSHLTDASYTAFGGGDSTTGKAYQKLLDALDKSADLSLRQVGHGDLADELATVRPLYSNYKMLTKGTTAAGGDVSPARVASGLRTRNPDAFRTGSVDGPLGTIGQWSESFPPLRPGSQTAERGATREMITDPITIATLGLPTALAAKATTSPWATWLPSKMGGTTAGKATQKVLDPLANVGVQSLFRRMFAPQTP